MISLINRQSMYINSKHLTNLKLHPKTYHYNKHQPMCPKAIHWFSDTDTKTSLRTLTVLFYPSNVTLHTIAVAPETVCGILYAPPIYSTNCSAPQYAFANGK